LYDGFLFYIFAVLFKNQSHSNKVIMKNTKITLNVIYQRLAIMLMLMFTASASFGQTLYAVTGAGSGTASTLYTLNPADGSVVSTIGATGVNSISGLAVHPSTGVIYAHVNEYYGTWGDGALATLNPTTGAATIIGRTNLQSPDMTFSPSGTLYAWSENGGDVLCTINLSTGAPTQIGSHNISTYGTGLCFNPVNSKLYLKNDASWKIYELDSSNGTVISAVSYSGSTNNMLAFNSSGTAFTGIRNSSSSFTLYTLDISAGTLTSIGSNSLGKISALAYGAAPRFDSISVTPASGTYTGGVNTNLYIGYPNNTAIDTLKAINGGSATKWSPATYLSCTSCSTTVFSPTAAGSYTITASSGGISKSTTICVKDIRVPNTSGTKAAVYMCHLEPTKTTPQTLAVVLRGISGHFQYHKGDKLGVCGNTCATSKRDFEVADLVVDEQYLEVMCTPNPFRNSFKLNYVSHSDLEATISIYGMTGNLMETTTLSGLANEAELGTNLPNGIYTVSFNQGDNKKVFRMIKLD
jgi:hypothetical protein